MENKIGIGGIVYPAAEEKKEQKYTVVVSGNGTAVFLDVDLQFGGLLQEKKFLVALEEAVNRVLNFK